MMTEWLLVLTNSFCTEQHHIIARRGDPPTTDIFSRTPHKLIIKLFTNKFWSDLPAAGNKGSLRAKELLQRQRKLPQKRVVLAILANVMTREVRVEGLKIVNRDCTASGQESACSAELARGRLVHHVDCGDARPAEEKELELASNQFARRPSRLHARRSGAPAIGTGPARRLP